MLRATLIETEAIVSFRHDDVGLQQKKENCAFFLLCHDDIEFLSAATRNFFLARREIIRFGFLSSAIVLCYALCCRFIFKEQSNVFFFFSLFCVREPVFLFLSLIPLLGLLRRRLKWPLQVNCRRRCGPFTSGRRGPHASSQC